MMNTKTKIALAMTSILAAGAAQAATTHTMTDGRFDFKGADTVVTADGHNDVQGAFDMANGTGAFTTSTNFVGYTWAADVVEMRMHNTMMGGTDQAAVEANTFDFTVREFFSAGSGNVSCVAVPTAGYDACAAYTDIVFEGVPGGSSNSIAYNLTAGQFAAHTLFDWSSSADIPVLAIMQVTNDAAADGFMTVASVDLSGNISNNPFGTNAPGADSNGDGVVDGLDSDAVGNGSLYGVAMPECTVTGSPTGIECGPFPNQTPIFSGTIVPVPVPVPAAVWLFGSGLLGLVGVARRRKA